jgi:ribosome-associated translation inhibitor RaiA
MPPLIKIALSFFAIALIRILMPSRIDIITTILMIIAIFLLLKIDLKDGMETILKYIEKIKLGKFEIEFRNLIKRIDAELEKAKESIGEREYKLPESTINHIDEIVREASKDPRAAFLLLSSKIERKVRERFVEAGIEEKDRFIPLSRMIEIGIRLGVFPKELLPSFRDFWAVRNRVVHGEAFEVEDSVIFSLISLGIEILKLLSIESTLKELMMSIESAPFVTP